MLQKTTGTNRYSSCTQNKASHYVVSSYFLKSQIQKDETHLREILLLFLASFHFKSFMFITAICNWT